MVVTVATANGRAPLPSTRYNACSMYLFVTGIFGTIMHVHKKLTVKGLNYTEILATCLTSFRYFTFKFFERV